MDMMPRAASPESTPTAPHPHRPRIGFSIDFLVGKSAAKAVDADPADSDGADEETPVKKMEERRADSGALKGNKSPGSSAEHSPPSSPASSRSNSPDGVRSASNPLLTFPSWNPAAGGGNFGAGGVPPGPYLDMAALASVRALYAQQPDAGRTPFYPSAAPGSLFNLHGTSAAVAAAAAAAGAAGPASGPALPGAFGRPSEALAQQWWLLAQARQQQQRLLAAAAASQRFPPGPELAGFLLSPFRKPKRVRTAFSPSQLLKLEHAFEKNHYVVGAERKQLAQALNLTETQVKVWFQNRRTKHKRVQQEDEPEPGKGSGSGGSSQSKSSGNNNNNNNSGASSSTSAQESRQRHHDDEDDSEMSDIDLEDSDDQMDLSASSHHLHHPHLHHHHRSDSN